jgi:glycosyltransferase involved in cell wall biosynthesis
MSDTPQHQPRVTIVISARERFGAALESLDNVLGETPEPVELVYVSGRAPGAVVEEIDRRAAERGFRHVKLDRFLSPNESRNIGVAEASGEYVVFLDNDVFCAPGWLTPLVECADETGADVVAPLTCHGSPLHKVVHQAGGLFAHDPEAFFAQKPGEREVIDVMHHQNDKVAELTLERSETQLCEFHAVLVRRSVFDRIGPLDEGMMATKEHLDFCMSVVRSGGKVMFEPKSIVTYLFPNRRSPITRADMPFFLVRWSPEWQRRSLRHFQAKWGVKDEGYLEKRDHMLSWRHEAGIVRPLLYKIPLVGRMTTTQKISRRTLSPLVRRISAALVAQEDRRRARAGVLPSRQASSGAA